MTLEWLKANALFSCQFISCRELYSFHACDLRLYNDEPICEPCFDEGSPVFASGLDEWMLGNDEAVNLDWSDLPKFDPFEFLIVGERDDQGAGAE